MTEKEIKDPSANVLNLVGNATKYLEGLHRQSEVYFNQKLEAESKRVDANRDDDRKAVGVANDRAMEQAAVLAQAVAVNAENLRSSMAKTAETLAEQLQLSLIHI